MSAYEYQHGIAKARGELQAALQRTWATFLDVFEILPLSLAGAQRYGQLRSRYEREVGATTRATNRHASDFLLAATALDTAAILVSSDRLFTKLRTLEPQLQVEDWRLAWGYGSRLSARCEWGERRVEVVVLTAICATMAVFAERVFPAPGRGRSCSRTRSSSY